MGHQSAIFLHLGIPPPPSMPLNVDSKRNPYPKSFPITEFKGGSCEKQLELVEARKAQNRAPNAFRKLYIDTNFVHGAAGSCYMELGKTSVICTIQGPRELPRSQSSVEARVNCSVKYASFSRETRLQPTEDADEKEMGQDVVKAVASSIELEKYPKAQIDIAAVVLHDDGSALSLVINASVVALYRAGISMRDFPVATTVLVSDRDVYLDPNKQEIQIFKSKAFASSQGMLTTAYLSSLDELSFLSQQGKLTAKQTANAIQYAMKGAIVIIKVIKQRISDI